MNYQVEKETFLRLLKNASKSTTHPLNLEFCQNELLAEFLVTSSITHDEDGVRKPLCDGYKFPMRFCTSVECLEADDEIFEAGEEEDDDIEITFFANVRGRDKLPAFIAELENLSEIILEVDFGDAGNMSAKGCKTIIDLMRPEDAEAFIPGPVDYDGENKDAEIRWKTDDPQEVCFPVHGAEGYWGTVRLPEADSVEGINAVRKFIDRDKAKILEGDSFMSGTARRGKRKQANVTPQVKEPAAAAPPAAPEAPKAPEPTPEPAKAPEAPKAETPAPAPQKAPETKTEPPLENPEVPEENNNAPEAGEESPKKTKRRTKEEIRADKRDGALAFLEENKDSEDVHDPLRAFCAKILQEDGYHITRPGGTEPETLENALDKALINLDTLRDGLKSARSMSEGLMTKEQLLSKLAASL